VTPSPDHPAERLYVAAWDRPNRALIALAMDESLGRVRPEFAAWVRAEIRKAAPR
jgi:hypothetical protein